MWLKFLIKTETNCVELHNLENLNIDPNIKATKNRIM